MAGVGGDEVLNGRTRRLKLDTWVFVCFDSSVSATLRFLDSKHLAVPIKMPQHKWPGAGEHCGVLNAAISRALLFSGRDLALDFVFYHPLLLGIFQIK